MFKSTSFEVEPVPINAFALMVPLPVGARLAPVPTSIAAEVFVPRMNQWRVTITLPVIRAAGLRMVVAAGESKRPILEDVRRGVDHPIVRATADLESWWFVDRAAAPVENP